MAGKKEKLLALAVACGFFATAGLATGAEAAEIALPVDEVVITGNDRMTESEIYRLLPSLRQKGDGERRVVDVDRLSREIKLVNDAGAAHLKADFKKQTDGNYEVVITVEEKKAERVSINVNNTGNEYTGDWRVGVNYLNRDLTGVSDTLGAAYITSPGHWDDVNQGASSTAPSCPVLATACM